MSGSRSLAAPSSGALVALACLLAPAVGATGNDGWQVVARSGKGPDAAVLASRPRPGSGYPEYRMELGLQAPPERVLAALLYMCDEPSTYPAGLERTALRRDGDTVIYYDVIGVPFVTDREVVLRMESERNPETGVHVLRWDDVDEGPPPHRKRVRMPNSEGSWTLTPTDAGTTRVLYRSHIELGGTLPASLVNGTMPKEILGQAEMLRRTVERGTFARR